MFLIKLIIDMDEVICDFLGELCKRYNEMTGSSLSPNQCTQYDLTPFVGEIGKKIFIRSGFFSELNAFPGAIKTIEKLKDEGHSIMIATDAKGSDEAAADKKSWVEKHLPFLSPDEFLVTAEKYLLDGDLLFDDSPEVLNKFKGIKVVMDRPYNRHIKGFRIYNNNWKEFYFLIRGLSV